ncbi:GNAT family N-acetyltransferase [Rhodococcus sp. NPDC003382]
MTFAIHDESTIETILDDWHDLTTRIPHRVATRPSYALTWFRALGRGRLAVCAVRRHGRLVAVAPLHSRSRLGVRAYRVLGHGLATIGGVLAEDDDALNELVEALATRRIPLQLTHLESTDPLIVALRRSNCWHVDAYIDDHCLTIDLEPGQTAAALRGKKTLKALRRIERSLEKAGTPASVEVVTEPADLARRWPDIAGVAARADADSGRVDFCAPPIAAFTRPFLEAEARAGSLLVAGLIVGDRWVAHEIMFRTGSTAEMWMARFDPGVAHLRPGHLLHRWLADHHDDLGITRFDYLLGTSEFKSRWANGGYDAVTVTATPRGRPLHRWTLDVADRAADRIRPLRSVIEIH